MKNINELRNMTNEQLEEKLLELRKTQFNLRLKKANGMLDKPHVVKSARKSIARIKTIMTERAGVSDV